MCLKRIWGVASRVFSKVVVAISIHETKVLLILLTTWRLQD